MKTTLAFIFALLISMPAMAQHQTGSLDESHALQVRRPGMPFTISPAEQIVLNQHEKIGGSAALRNNCTNIVTFLRGTAGALNAANISGGPYGVLVKTGGNNCNGYAADIICTGQGSSQKQWDVLVDAGGDSRPGWSGPLTTIAVRPCEIIEGPSVPTPVPTDPPSGVTNEELLKSILALGQMIDALENQIGAVALRVDQTFQAADLAATRSLSILGILEKLPSSPGSGPIELPPYRGDLWGIGITSYPCPTCPPKK